MLTLNLEKAEVFLKQAEEKNQNDLLLPKEVTKKQFEHFVYLMNCKTKEELEEVTFEDILDLLKNSDLYASCIVDGDAWIQARQEAVGRAKSALQRRII